MSSQTSSPSHSQPELRTPTPETRNKGAHSPDRLPAFNGRQLTVLFACIFEDLLKNATSVEADDDLIKKLIVHPSGIIHLSTSAKGRRHLTNQLQRLLLGAPGGPHNSWGTIKSCLRKGFNASDSKIRSRDQICAIGGFATLSPRRRHRMRSAST
jgi:hypothetical protein